MFRGKELYKIATRFYPPAAFEMGHLSQVVRMPELFGFGMSNIVVRFDGKKMDVFRVKEDMDRIRDLAIAFALAPAFTERVEAFARDVDAFIELTKDTSQDPLGVIEKMSALYPYSVISFFLTGAWESFLPEDKRDEIAALCTRYREPADYMMSAYVAFVEKKLAERNLSVLSPLAVLRGEDPEKYAWMEKEFIFSDNAFLQESWEEFLERRGYSYKEEEISGFSGVLRGMVAHPGKVSGRVRTVWSPRDIVGFQVGDVLVTSMTSPLFLPAIRLASAIIIDEGGITCHAAIVARELEKPCVIGAKTATKFLKDGDVVEVDAENGLVCMLSR